MNQVFGIYFDHERDGIFCIDAIHLAPSEPEASWLKREVEEGWTQAQRLEAARFDLVRIAAAGNQMPQNCRQRPSLPIGCRSLWGVCLRSREMSSAIP